MKLFEALQQVVEYGDPRSKHLWLMSTPWPMLSLVATYLYVSLSLGPRLMKNRKPIPVEPIMPIYNVIQIFANGVVFYKAMVLGWATDYSWRCEPVDWSWSPHAREIVRIVHLFFIIKVTDLLDTVFFILRGKWSHLSFLHIYHHAVMVIAGWIATKYFPGGHITFLGLVNSFVHIAMYTYYLITSLNPDMKRNIWWKKHITHMQMVQFLMIAVHGSQVLFNNTCDYPTAPFYFLVPQNFLFLYLFYDFYRRAYSK